MAVQKKEVQKKTKKATKKNNNKVNNLVPTVDQLLAAGVHFGHTTRRWHPVMDNYIYKKKKNIHVIDIRKTQELIAKALEFLTDLLNSGKKDIMVVGTKRQISGLVKDFGVKHNLFYVTEKWLGGMFTNYKEVQNMLNNLEKLEEEQIKLRYVLTKHELSVRERKIQKLKDRLEGVMFMRKLPDCVLVIDTKYEKIAVKEALLANIPTVGIVDTNADFRHVNYPVPANDDAMKSVSLLLSVFAELISKNPNERLEKERKDYQKKLEELSKKVDQEYRTKQAMEGQEESAAPAETEEKKDDSSEKESRVIKVTAKPLTALKLPESVVQKLEKSGIRSVEMLEKKTNEELRAVDGVGPKTATRITKALNDYKKGK